MKSLLAGLVLLGLVMSAQANPLQSPSRRAEDDAYKRGRERREALERGDTPRTLEQDNYGSQTEEEKEAYKAGYRGEEQKRRR